MNRNVVWQYMHPALPSIGSNEIDVERGTINSRQQWLKSQLFIPYGPVWRAENDYAKQ